MHIYYATATCLSSSSDLVCSSAGGVTLRYKHTHLHGWMTEGLEQRRILAGQTTHRLGGPPLLHRTEQRGLRRRGLRNLQGVGVRQSERGDRSEIYHLFGLGLRSRPHPLKQAGPGMADTWAKAAAEGRPPEDQNPCLLHEFSTESKVDPINGDSTPSLGDM